MSFQGSPRTVTLSDEAVEALEIIRGSRTETLEETLGRAIGNGRDLAREKSQGGKVVVRHRNGKAKVLTSV